MSDDARRGHRYDPDLSLRLRPADARDDLSAELDAHAAKEDSHAIARDVSAVGRDDANSAREIGSGGVDTEAAAARYWALRDRLGASGDRLRAANMRLRAQSDRFDSAADRLASSIDELTGSYRREPGLTEIARDLGAARRTKQSLVLLFIDIDDLKTTNDTKGHAAGDKVLQRVSAALRSMIREYDLTVRYGGDEFLVSIVGVTEGDASARIDVVNSTLKAEGLNTVSCGVVTVGDIEPLSSAINRADLKLYKSRTGDDSSDDSEDIA